MTMMLVALFSAAAVGLFARKFGKREIILCLAIAVGLTLEYFFRPLSMT